MTPQARSDDDRFEVARAVADAVLYEGCVLYPYRASAQKNQMRWQFGVLVPPACSLVDPSERGSMRTECLVELGDRARLAVRVRCLQLQKRSLEGSADFDIVPDQGAPWDETVEQTVETSFEGLHPLATASRVVQFQFPSTDDADVVRSLARERTTWIVRRRELIDGRLGVAIAPAGPPGLAKVTVTVANMSRWSCQARDRSEMLRHSLVAVHTMLAVDGGRFVSILDPPEPAVEAARSCANEGTYPVLVGADDAVVLSSPIVLYDHPQVAAESPGDLYDATEIDEILALRVLALTEEEKAEARATDPRAATVVDRVESMAPADWARLHGEVRPVDPPAKVPWWDPDAEAAVDPATDTVRVGDVEVGRGARVVLRPTRRSDAQDIFLVGQLATVAGVYRDVDDGHHVAVTLDADPAADLHRWQGRYLYFLPEEIEPLGSSLPLEETT
jgi:hypothetical protein